MNQDKALKDYATCLQMIRDRSEAFEQELTILANKRMKIESWLIQNGQNIEVVPQIVEDDRPFVAWVLVPQTDMNATKYYMQMRDVLKPEIENKSKDRVAELKAGMETIENWALQQLNERGGNGFKTDSATVSRTTVTSYKVADKALLVKDAVENGYASELPISFRPNSSLMSDILKERGELPAGVSSSTFYEARFTKSSK